MCACVCAVRLLGMCSMNLSMVRTFELDKIILFLHIKYTCKKIALRYFGLSVPIFWVRVGARLAFVFIKSTNKC